MLMLVLSENDSIFPSYLNVRRLVYHQSHVLTHPQPHPRCDLSTSNTPWNDCSDSIYRSLSPAHYQVSLTEAVAPTCSRKVFPRLFLLISNSTTDYPTLVPPHMYPGLYANLCHCLFPDEIRYRKRYNLFRRPASFSALRFNC